MNVPLVMNVLLDSLVQERPPKIDANVLELNLSLMVAIVKPVMFVNPRDVLLEDFVQPKKPLFVDLEAIVLMIKLADVLEAYSVMDMVLVLLIHVLKLSIVSRNACLKNVILLMKLLSATTTLVPLKTVDLNILQAANAALLAVSSSLL